MKASLLFVVVCLLGVAQPALSHIDVLAVLHKGVHTAPKFDILALLHGGHKKKPQNEDPTGILSQVMAAANQGLALAETHHDQAIKEARGQLHTLLTKQGGELSKAVQQYNDAMAGALASLSHTIDTSKHVLSKAQKATSGESWDSSSGHAQATLNAQVSFVNREIRKASRKQKASIREAISDADLLLEDGVVKLSRKIGDTSDMVTKTQNDIGVAAETAPTPASFLQRKGGESMDLDKSVAALKAGTKQVDVSFQQGLKTMKAAFAKVEQALASGAKSITDKLDASQEEDLKKVRAASGVALAAPPKPALRSHKKHA